MKRILYILLISIIMPLHILATELGEKLPKEMRESYIRYGEKYLGRSWATLPVTVFARYKKDGNRAQYQDLYFARRKQLAALVMAEIVEGKDRFIPDIVDGLSVVMEETWWGIPAHYDYMVPRYDIQTVDLYNAETASLIAWTGNELKPQLDRFAPDIYKRMTSEIERRILRPVLGTKYWWKTAGMNWNPWICSNWLTCVLYYEQNADLKAQAIAEISKCLRAFIDAYPNDGGCDEGTGYWDRAPASLFECLSLMHEHGIRLPDEEKLAAKIANMGAYIYRMYIGNGHCVNFADAHQGENNVHLNVLYPFGQYLDDNVMKQFAAYIAEKENFWSNPAPLYERSGNFPTLGRELMLLRSIDALRKEKARQPLVEAWLPNLQVMIARTHPQTDTPKGLFLAAKGGHNYENHNHNDVGSFIVYADAEPLIVDPGVGEYTSQTFSKNRYDIWMMQSQYHNLPQINGIDQHDGKRFAAKLVAKGNRSLTLDIAEAYPKEAHVKRWQRVLSIKDKAVVIDDNYELDTLCRPTRLMLMTPIRPNVAQPGIIKLGEHTIEYPSTLAEATSEEITLTNDRVMRRAWGEKLYRICLTMTHERLRNSFSVTIR